MATVAAVEVGGGRGGGEWGGAGEEQVEEGEREEEGECLAAVWRYQGSLLSENQKAAQHRQALILSK